jgi:hypothetical protein
MCELSLDTYPHEVSIKQPLPLAPTHREHSRRVVHAVKHRILEPGEPLAVLLNAYLNRPKTKWDSYPYIYSSERWRRDGAVIKVLVSVVVRVAP